MSSAPDGTPPRRPWHLWVVAFLVLALYVGGARDYLLILTGDTGYIREQFGAGGLDYFADYPIPLRLIWTLNIIGGLFAPILLVVRSWWAHRTAAVSAGAQLVLLVVTFALLDRWSMLGAMTSWFDTGIGVLTVLFAVYCWVMRPQKAIQS